MRTSMNLIVLGVMACWAGIATTQPKQEREFDYVLRKKPDVTHGEKLYETCAACHGPVGEGASDGTVPAIAGQHFNVLAKQIVDFRHDKRRELRMQHFVDDMHLTFAQDIADVARFIAGMKPTVAADAPSVANRVGGDKYSKLCMRCHGANGEGQADWLVPRVAGQRYAYLVDELHLMAKNGRPNMSQNHVELVSGLDDQSIQAIAAHLSNRTVAD